MGSKISKDLLDLFEKDGIQLSHWGKKQQKWFIASAMMLYDKPEDAHNVLRAKGLRSKKSNFGREVIINRIIEKYRRLVRDNPKKFKEYLSKK